MIYGGIYEVKISVCRGIPGSILRVIRRQLAHRTGGKSNVVGDCLKEAVVFGKVKLWDGPESALTLNVRRKAIA